MSEFITVPAHVIESVKAERLPQEIPGCPLSLEARRLLLADCPVTVVDPSIEASTYDKQIDFTEPRIATTYSVSDFDIEQPSTKHCRSFELFGPNLHDSWQDEYGNTYSSFSLKGNNYSKPGIMESPTASEGLIAWGLQESKIIERVLRASAVLRSRGIGTEYIIGLAEPKVYPIPTVNSQTKAYEDLTLAEYKEHIVTTYWKQLPEEDQTVARLAEITQTFQDMTFYISLRAMDSPNRLGDLPDLLLHNAAEIEEHLQIITIPTLAHNLAALHVDMAHGFLHKYNVTSEGSIVDLDSVHGEPLGLGDEPATDSERAEDLTRIMTDMLDMGNYMLYVNTDKAQKILKPFLSTYMTASILELGYDVAKDRMASVITEMGKTMYNNQWTGVYGRLPDLYMQTMRHCFLDVFYREEDPANLAAIHEVHDKVYEAIAYHRDNEVTYAVLLEHTRDYMYVFKSAIAQEYMDELQDPNFDLVSAFLQDTNAEPRRIMAHRIMRALQSEIAHACVDPESELIALQNEANPDIRAITIQAVVAEYEANIKAIADSLTASILTELESHMREVFTYTRPQSLTPDYASYSNFGEEADSVWLTTEQVPFSIVASLIQQGEVAYEIKPLPFNGQHRLTVNEDEDIQRIDQIISDTLFDGYQAETSVMSPSISFDLSREAGAIPLTYIAVVERTEDGQKPFVHLYLQDPALVTASFAQGKYDLVSAGSPQPEQAVLF